MYHLFMKSLLVLIALVVISVSAYFIFNGFDFKSATIFRSNSKIGNIKLDGKSYNEGLALLNKSLNSPIYLNLDFNSRSVTLKELGFSLNTEVLEKLTKNCKIGKLKILCRNTSNENVNTTDAINVDKQVLNSFLNDYEKGIQFLAKNTIISLDNYTFKSPGSNAIVKIDRSDFENKESLNKLLSTDPTKITLKLKNTDDKDAQNTATLDLVEKISIPLLIKYGRNPIYIPGEKIREFIEVVDENGFLTGRVSELKVASYLESLKKDNEKPDVKILKKESVSAIQRTILYRAADYQVNLAVVLPLEGKPRSNGGLHEVYLEVIKSQQRLYRFEHGKLVKTYIVSTGLTWETPPGEYKVLGKQKMTISYFGNWYMPNYLPLGTVNGYRFGFHEIPYHVDAAGKVYSRDPNTMGSPATGGCIQLTPDDSLEIFNWAKVGMPVYIYE